MTYIITGNKFSRDSNDIRSTRLNFISANFDDYSTELELETSLLTWAQGAGAALFICNSKDSPRLKPGTTKIDSRD